MKMSDLTRLKCSIIGRTFCYCTYGSASLVAQMARDLPAMWETSILFLGWEDPLEEGMAITPVFLPGESHGQRSLVGYSPEDHKELDMTEVT